MARIAFIGHDAGRTGAPIVLLHLLTWLKDNSDWKIETHIARTGELIDAYLNVSPVFINGVRIKDAIDAQEQQGRITRLIKKVRSKYGSRPVYDLIYSNTATNGDLLWRLSNGGRVKVITHVHEMDYWIQRSGKANWETVRKCTDIFIAASGAVEAMLHRRGIPNDRIRVIEEFIEVDAVQRAQLNGMSIRRKYGIPENAFVVAGGGAKIWRKGKDLFVQLAGRLKSLGPAVPIHFIWIGSKLDREAGYWATHDAKALGLEGCITWTGSVNDPLDHFAACDAFAMLSREDPFPLVCLEAALLGKPITCFHGAGGIPDLVESDAGAIVPYLDLNSMAQHLFAWCADPGLRSELGNNAARKVKERYAVDVQARKIRAVIDEQLHSASIDHTL